VLGVSISVGVEERGEAGTDASINTSTDLPKKKKKKKKERMRQLRFSIRAGPGSVVHVVTRGPADALGCREGDTGPAADHI